MEKVKMKATTVPYLSVTMRQNVQKAKDNGMDVIDFTVGDPDIKPPDLIVDLLTKEIGKAENHRYPIGESEGLFEFRSAVTYMYRERYGVKLNPYVQVNALIGSKEGAHYLCLSLVQPGDIVIICEPAYMTYKYCAELAGAQVYSIPLRRENGYLPVLESIPYDVLKRTRLFFVNYPNNPTGAVATFNFYKKLLNMARKFDFIVCNDNAYGEIYFDGEKPYSLLQVPGADEVAVELNSISKTYNLCGWRLGMLVGNKNVISKVLAIKRYTDAGIFMPIQKAASKALVIKGDYIEQCRKVYDERRNQLINGLRSNGYDIFEPKAGMFVWSGFPFNIDSNQFCNKLLMETGIACNPGIGFGEYGEGYVRFAMTVPVERINEAIERISLLKI